MIYILSAIVSFIAVFLKGFQHKNVIGNHQKAVFITSCFMAAFDVVAVTIIIKGGLLIALTAGTGAAFGMIASMRTHDWFFRSKEPANDPEATGSSTT